jgi:anti-sigma regulatory factor (Ser/Thr protein kinase)
LEPTVKYHITLNDITTAVNDVSRSITLISRSVELRPRNQLQLRLSLYELAANTVDHGTFEARRPTIRIALYLTDAYATVEYQDNANAFVPGGASEGNLVEKHIDSQSKRGLGLYMLNKICDDISYERAGGWNTTRIRFSWLVDPVMGAKE